MDTVYVVLENIYFDYEGPVASILGISDTFNSAKKILESGSSEFRESEEYTVGKDEETKDEEGRRRYLIRFDDIDNPGDYYEYYIVPETLVHDTEK